MMADKFPAMSPPMIEPITNVPASVSPEHKLYEAAMEEVSTQITTFFACLDMKQFHAIFSSNFPGHRFIKTFNFEHFKTIVVQAFRAPKAAARKEEVDAIIHAKLRLEKKLAYMQWMFGLFKVAGLHDGDVVLPLAWLAKMNQESYSELNARRTLNNLDLNSSTFTSHYASGDPQLLAISPPPTGEKLPGPESWESGQDRLVQHKIVHARTPSLHVPNSFETEWIEPRMQIPIDVQTARQMAAQRRRPGGKLTNNETLPYSNPDPLLKYRHPWSM